MADSIFLKSALAYARMQWPVFPLAPATKDQPLTKRGSLDATTDEVQIRKWWGPQPRANIALATGRLFFALDSDELHGGYESLEKLEREHGKLPDTIQQMSGSGHSRHWLFQMPDFEVRNSASKIAPGLDIRGIGGYLVGAPSIHPNTGKPYIWDGLDPLEKQTLLPAPAWLLEKLRARPELVTNGQAGAALPEKIRKGQQNDVLFRRGCAMRGQGFEEREIYAALSEVNKLRCEEPGTEDYVRGLAAQICRDYAAGDALGLKAARARPAEEKPLPTLPPNVLLAPELWNKELQKPVYAVENMIVSPGLTLIISPSKVGKTVLAVQMAFSVANGFPLFDSYQTLQTPVVMVEWDDLQAENSVQDFLHKSRAASITMPFFLYPPPEDPNHVTLSDPQFEVWLRDQIRTHQAGFVVLDSYTALRGLRAGGKDIVKVESVEIGMLSGLARDTHAAIVLVHHDSKSSAHLDWSERGAGTFAITAGAESLIRIARYPDLPERDGARMVALRGRHLDGDEFVLRFRKDTLDYDLVLTGAASKDYPQLVELYRQFRGVPFSAKEVSSELGWSRATAYRILARMMASGVLRKESTAFTWDPDFKPKGIL